MNTFAAHFVGTTRPATAHRPQTRRIARQASSVKRFLAALLRSLAMPSA